MKYYLLFFFLIISLGIKAQESNLKIIKSKVFTNEKYKTSLLFAKEDTNGDVFLVRNYYKSNASPIGYYIEHYDKDLTLLKSNKIEVNRSELRGIYINDSEVILLQFKYLQKEKKYAFVTLTSNKEIFDFTEIEIYSIARDKINRYDYFGIRKDPEYTYLKEYKFGDIVTSNNEKFTAINLFIKEKNRLDSFLVVVFNEQFEKVYEHVLEEIQTENKKQEALFDYQNMKLDDEGNVFLLGKVYKTNSKKEKIKGKPNYTFELFKINGQGQKQISLEDNKYYIDRLQIVLKNNTLSCIGLYYEKISDIKLIDDYSKDGIVRININNDEITLKNYQPFQESINKLSFKKLFSFTAVYDNFYINKLFVADNGDILIYSEQFSTYLSDNNLQTKNSYGNIIAMKINNEGELLWTKSINKFQKAWNIENIPVLSYSALFNTNSNAVFFNAKEAENKGNDEVKFSFSKSKNILYSAVINKKGELNYKSLSNEDLKGITLEVRFGVLLDDSTLLVEATTTDDKPLLVKISL